MFELQFRLKCQLTNSYNKFKKKTDLKSPFNISTSSFKKIPSDTLKESEDNSSLL